jgi:formylglycine-generating enzyme required for sulfatase activity
MKLRINTTLSLLAALSAPAFASVTIDYVTVGNAGNAADTTGYGAVPYEYRIGKYEVTNAQYAEFLNAKAATDSYSLYNPNMSSYGITRSGSSGTYTYSVTGGLANRPVVYVSWFDAARFANWLINGQGSGDTETGAYTLNGALSGMGFSKNPGSSIFLPSEDEWYKAAYYNPTTDSYSLYATGNNNISQSEATYHPSTGTSDVGFHFGSPSPIGTFDQSGNVFEWNDGVFTQNGFTLRGMRGGAWYSSGLGEFDLRSTSRWGRPPELEQEIIGFRLASIPEPSSNLLLMLVGAVGLICRKR